MRLSKRIPTMLMAASLMFGATSAFAQDGDAGMTNASISGDTNSACAVAVQDFLRTGDASAFTSGASATTVTMDAEPADATTDSEVMATEEALDTTGAADVDLEATEAADAALTTDETLDTTGTMDSQPTPFDLSAFGEGTYEVHTLIVGDNAVFAEFTFTADADSEIASQLPEGATILTPAAAVFDCEADTITEARVYYQREEVSGGMDVEGAEDTDDMAGTDTIEATETAAMDAEAGADTLEGAEAGADTLEGADAVVGAHTVDGPHPTAMDTVEGEGVDTLEGADTGMNDVAAADLPMDDPYAVLDAITDNPEAYMGQTVTVAGPITEYAGGDISNGFIIVEEDLIGDDPALILGADGELLTGGAWEVGQQVIVTGVVRGMSVTELEGELGYDLTDDVYAGWENIPVIVASEVGPYDPNAQ